MSRVQPRRSTRAALAAALAVLLLALLQVTPRLGRAELRHEEGRRATPAREMMRSGDWLVPTVWQAPYLNKPPLMYWAIAASSLRGGEVTPLSARVPSALAAALLALATFLAALRWTGFGTALAAGLLAAHAPLLVEKGRTAEIDALFALFVFGAGALWAVGAELLAPARRPRLALTASGLLLGGALLAKGPAALLFYASPPIALAIALRRRELALSWRLLAPLGLGLALAGAWALVVLARLGPARVAERWVSEISRQGDPGLAIYLGDRASFLFGSLGGFLPASALCLLALGTSTGRRIVGDPVGRLALLSSLPPLAFFLIFPGTSARYVLPLAPWVAIAGARILGLAREEIAGAGAPYARRMRIAGGALALLGLLGAFVLALPAIVPAGKVPAGGLGPLFAALLAASALALFAALRAGRRELSLWAGLALFALFGLAQHCHLQPPRDARHQHVARAARITACVPPGAPLYVTFQHDFNLLYYVERELRAWPAGRRPAPGDHILWIAPDRKTVEREIGLSIDISLEMPLPKNNLMHLVHVLATPPADSGPRPSRESVGG